MSTIILTLFVIATPFLKIIHKMCKKIDDKGWKIENGYRIHEGNPDAAMVSQSDRAA